MINIIKKCLYIRIFIVYEKTQTNKKQHGHVAKNQIYAILSDVLENQSCIATKWNIFFIQ